MVGIFSKVKDNFKKVRDKTIAYLLTVEEHNDPNWTKRRLEICATCPKNVNGVCSECGCFLHIKATLAQNYNPKTLLVETTHCPLGKWFDPTGEHETDEHISEYYKSINNDKKINKRERSKP